MKLAQCVPCQSVRLRTDPAEHESLLSVRSSSCWCWCLNPEVEPGIFLGYLQCSMTGTCRTFLVVPGIHPAALFKQTWEPFFFFTSSGQISWFVCTNILKHKIKKIFIHNFPLKCSSSDPASNHLSVKALCQYYIIFVDDWSDFGL